MDDYGRGEQLFNQIIAAIQNAPCPENKEESKFWTDGEKILSKDRDALRGIADLIDDIAGYCITSLYYYDPESDAIFNTVDIYTGYHSLELAE